MIFEIIRGGGELTGWGKNGPAYFFPGERMGRPILSPGKKLTGGNSGLLHRVRKHTVPHPDPRLRGGDFDPQCTAHVVRVSYQCFTVCLCLSVTK